MSEVRQILEKLYDMADSNEKLPHQPYSKWDAKYAERLSKAFGVEIVLRAGRSKLRGGTLCIITEDGAVSYKITIYENQPGNLEHEISHFIQFAVFGNECLMDRKNYAMEEIRAESTAYAICVLTGNHTRCNRSVPYIRKYAEVAGIDPRTLIPEIESRVAEFVRRGVMPPAYEPIEQPPPVQVRQVQEPPPPRLRDRRRRRALHPLRPEGQRAAIEDVRRAVTHSRVNHTVRNGDRHQAVKSGFL